MLDHGLELRPLEQDDWVALKALRLHALRSEPHVFSRRYDDEVHTCDADWRQLASNDSHAQRIFGLFDGETMIGLTAIFSDQEDPTAKTAVLAMSYLRPSYRGRGLSHLFYQERLRWARGEGGFTRIRVSHRLSNAASRAANQSHGFREIATVARLWPDGTSEAEVFYELRLDRDPEPVKSADQ